MFRRPSLLTDISSLRCSDGGETIYDSACSSFSGDGDANHATAAAVYNSAIDSITAPSRALTSDEIEELGGLLRGTLNLTNTSCAIQAEEDAADLVNYVIDLIDHGDDTSNNNEDGDEVEDTAAAAASGAGGSTIGQVIEELEFMEMEICGPTNLEEMRMVLANYLSRLNGHKSLPQPDDGQDEAEGAEGNSNRAYGRRNSYQSKLRESDMHLSGIDLSAKTAAAKKREELAALSKRSGVGRLKDRMKMYNDGGTLRGSWTNPDADTDFGDDNIDLLEDCDPATMAERKQAQLEDILKDVSLTEKEQTQRMKEVQAEFGVMEMKLRIRTASKRVAGRHSAPDMCRDDDDDEVNLNSKNAIPRAVRELKQGKRRSSVDLSAKSAVVKKAQELAYLKRQGSTVKDRMSMYTSQYNKKNSEEAAKNFLPDDEPKTTDELRREELVKIMRDRSLSREEKSKRMEEVRAKYAALSEEEDGESKQMLQQQDEIARWRATTHKPTKNQHDNSDGDESSQETMETAATTKVSIDLSAKSYAERRRASLESLENSISSNDSSGGKKHVMSVRERLSLYQNDEFIVKG